MAKAKPVPGLNADDAYAEAAAKIVEVRAGELMEHAEGVLDTGDIERLHDMRVATRRLRAALEIFEPCFQEKPFRETLAAVKRLADALGERRDRDVAIVSLGRFNEQMAAPDRRGVGSLIDRLRREQEEANAALTAHVDQANLRSLRESLGELVASARAVTA